MKQKDILLIVIVIIVSGAVSFVLSKFLFTVPKNQQAKVEVVQAISPDFPQPDVRYFNTNSIDPTKNITIGGDQNAQPFNGTSGQ